MSLTRDDVLAALAQVPAGVTTAELAEKLHVTRYAVGGILSKLAAYGKIDKGPPVKAGNANAALWKPKQVSA